MLISTVSPGVSPSTRKLVSDGIVPVCGLRIVMRKESTAGFEGQKNSTDVSVLRQLTRGGCIRGWTSMVSVNTSDKQPSCPICRLTIFVPGLAQERC